MKNIHSYQKVRRIFAQIIIVVCCLLSIIAPPPSHSSTAYAAGEDCNEARLRDLGAAIVNCNGDEVCDPGSGITQLSGEDNIAKIFNYFLPKGYKDYQVAGMLGNMDHESGIQPQVVQGKPGVVTPVETLTEAQLADPKLGYGIVQWTPVRKMIDPVKQAGKNPNDLAAQLDFLSQQLDGETLSPEKAAGDALKASTDVASATIAFETKYERHAGAPQPGRITKAEEILTNARANGATTPAASTIKNAYILGDSITHGAAAKYTEQLAGLGITPTISAVTSRSWNGAGNPALGATGTTGTGKAALQADAAKVREANVIVVALGTNGGLGSNPVDEVILSIRALNAVAPIYWVNIVSTNASIVPLVGPFNTKLQELQTANTIKVIDWAKYVDSTGTGTKDPTGILADGTHPKTENYPKLAQLVVNAITGADAIQAGSNCGGDSGPVNGTGLANTVKAYAWPEYHPAPYTEKKPEYAAAIQKAAAEGRYVGADGIDCGGFITTTMVDSGFEPRYNSDGKGGAVGAQQEWLDANWQKLGTITSTADLQPGDVAIRPSKHTWMFVGTIPGFNSQFASASLNERSAMAGREGIGGSDIVWYRKK